MNCLYCNNPCQSISSTDNYFVCNNCPLRVQFYIYNQFKSNGAIDIEFYYGDYILAFDHYDLPVASFENAFTLEKIYKFNIGDILTITPIKALQTIKRIMKLKVFL